MLDVLHKVKRPTKNKTCNSGTKDAHIHPLPCFINNHYGFWKITFGYQAKVTQKVRKSVYNIKTYFKQFFNFLERTSTFIIALFRAIYRSSYPDVFTKKRRSVTGSFFVRGVLWVTASVYIQHVPTGIHLFRVKIEKLESTNLINRSASWTVNFGQISHLVVVLLFLTLSTWLIFDLSHRKKNKSEADLGPTDHLRWSSLWQYNIRKSFRINKAVPI